MSWQIFLAAVALLLVCLALMYNSIRRAVVAVDYAWSQVLVQLQRRSDLIPQLQRVVAAYASHEAATLEQVTAARYATDGVEQAESKALHDESQAARLLLVAEQFPELYADRHFAALQQELAATENRLAFNRAYFNERTQAHNTKIMTWPFLPMARWMKCSPKPFFAAITQY